MRTVLLTSLALTMFVAVGCLSDNPVATLDDPTAPGDDPVRPDTLPFLATETNTIEVVGLPCFPPECDPPIPFLEAIFEGGGQATHLGNYTIHTTSQVFVIFDPQVQFTQSVMTAANGDELWWEGEGIATDGAGPGDVVFSGEYVITGGTGRFVDATGGETYAGTANVIEGVGEYVMEGRISPPLPPS